MTKAGSFPTQSAVQDRNQFPAMIAHAGTAGTTDLVRVTADSAGNLGVNVVSGEIIASLGTVDVVKDITTGSLADIAEVHTIGTIGSLTNIGTIKGIDAITALPDLPGGTLDVISSMPLNTITSGTVDAVAETIEITLPGGCSGVGMQIVGTWTGQLEFEATTDGTNWVSINTTSGAFSVNATSGNGIFVLPGGGYQKVRVRASSLSSGEAVVSLNASVGGGPIAITNPLPQGTNVLGEITKVGTVGSLSNIGVVHNAGTIASIPQVSVGTIPQVSVGTLPTLNVNTGTINVLPDIPGGTVDLITSGSLADVAEVHTLGTVGSITNIGMLHAGTVVTTMGDLSGGTIDLISAGSLTDIGEVHTLGTVGSITNIGMLHAGTVVTTMGDLSGGTIDLLSAGSLTDIGEVHTLGTVGSITNIGMLHAGTVVTTMGDLTGGTIDLITTQGSVADIKKVHTVGTLGSVAAVGVIHNAGTVAGLPDLPGGTIDLVTAVTSITDDLPVGTNWIGKVQVGDATYAAGVFGINADDYSPAEGLITAAFPMVFDGSTWDRLRGDSTNGLFANVKALVDLPGGTVDLVTAVSSVSNVAKGTVTKIEGGTVGKLDDLGSAAAIGVVHNAGTIAALPDLPGGTIDLVTAVTNVAGGTMVSNTPYSYSYHAAGTVNAVVKNAAGFLHAILVGDAVASAIIEVSDHASDGDGAVVLYMAGDTLGPALYPVNMTMGTGISTDITNQTHVTFIYK